MKVPLVRYEETQYETNVALKCPHCGNDGTFQKVGVSDLITFQPDNFGNRIDVTLGIRKCPNRNCNGHLFFISETIGNQDRLIFNSPSQTIDFERENIPQNIIDAFVESIKCHSINCFTASAIMIRKTLEELCFERNANGKNLYEKLKDLGTKIMIPKDLIEGMNELRLLGNDAAHIEAQTFNEIGKKEIEISIKFTKEILKAVYQYENLLGELKSLKKDSIKKNKSEASIKKV